MSLGTYITSKDMCHPDPRGDKMLPPFVDLDTACRETIQALRDALTLFPEETTDAPIGSKQAQKLQKLQSQPEKDPR